MRFYCAMILAAVATLTQMSSASAQVPHIFGTWTLNLERSDPREQIPQASVRSYSQLEDGFVLGLWVVIDQAGDPFFVQFTAKTDGADYPEYFPGALAALMATGTPSSFSYSETQLDEYTIEWVDKNEGEVIAWGTRGVSRDGQTMTIVANSRSAEGEVVTNTTLYDRRE
jgi:hypothetical protein